MPPAFDFGENWKNFSRNALNAQRVSEATVDFRDLCGNIELSGQTFLDVGFGQGLGLLNAANAGAQAIGCDINPKCTEVLTHNRRFFPTLTTPIPVVIGSILNDDVVDHLRHLGGSHGFAVVHSWGVLHHTGNMRLAISKTASLVQPSGHLILAIYNRHWSSLAWLAIKRCYVGNPRWLRRLTVASLLPVIYLAKWLATGRNPLRQERGMDFRYDVIDWVGGYPYEFASRFEIEAMMTGLGFHLIRFKCARVPTGCNEFVFKKA